MDCPVALCQCSIILSNRRDIPRVHKVEVQNMSMNIFVTSSLTVPWAAEAEVAEVRELDPSPGRAPHCPTPPSAPTALRIIYCIHITALHDHFNQNTFKQKQSRYAAACD